MSQRAFITDDGRSVVLPPGHGDRMGAGGQGQVFRSQLGGQPMAIKLCRELDGQRLIALQRLEEQCGTIATLPRHRLYHCPDGQLLEQIDQLTSLPGIGQGLQERLRQQLQVEIKLLQAQPAAALTGQHDAPLILALGGLMIEPIQRHQQQIDDLQGEAAALAISTRELNQEINRRLQQRDSWLVDFNRLF